jgi:hypothetical protein
MKQKNKDLCEALRRSEPEVPQLSADFAKQLAEQLKERDKGRDSLPNNPYKWLRLVAAIFVGIILVSGIAIAAIHFSKSSGFQDSRSSGNTLVEQSPSPVGGG